MKSTEFGLVSLNIAILTLFYTVLGGILSFSLEKLFTKYDKTWKGYDLGFKIGEVSLELVIIGLVAYWTMHFIQQAPPIFPVSKAFDESVDDYISGVFFAYAIFLFFDHLWAKIKDIYETITKDASRKNGPLKDETTTHQDGMRTTFVGN